MTRIRNENNYLVRNNYQYEEILRMPTPDREALVNTCQEVDAELAKAIKGK